MSDFPQMPIPNYQNQLPNIYNQPPLIQDELFTYSSAWDNENQNLKKQLNVDQKYAFKYIINAVYMRPESKKKLFFIDGPGGTGKTFLYKVLLNTIRLKGDIAIAVASSGIAALLLQNGRTAHSRLKIKIALDETSTCNITPDSDLAKLIKMAKIIIWDEAPMLNKLAFESVDRTFQDICGNKLPFGGKVFVFGG